MYTLYTLYTTLYTTLDTCHSTCAERITFQDNMPSLVIPWEHDITDSTLAASITQNPGSRQAQSKTSSMSTFRRCLRCAPHSSELLAGGEVDCLDRATGVIEPPTIICCSASFSFSACIADCCGLGSGGFVRGGSDCTPAEEEVVACECECTRCVKSGTEVSSGCEKSDLPANTLQESSFVYNLWEQLLWQCWTSTHHLRCPQLSFALPINEASCRQVPGNKSSLCQHNTDSIAEDTDQGACKTAETVNKQAHPRDSPSASTPNTNWPANTTHTRTHTHPHPHPYPHPHITPTPTPTLTPTPTPHPPPHPLPHPHHQHPRSPTTAKSCQVRCLFHTGPQKAHQQLC